MVSFDAESRIRTILSTVLPGYRFIYEGPVLKQKEDNLLLLIEELLPEQNYYKKNEILKEFYGDEASLICKGDALKIITESVAAEGIGVIGAKERSSREQFWKPLLVGS